MSDSTPAAEVAKDETQATPVEPPPPAATSPTTTATSESAPVAAQTPTSTAQSSTPTLDTLLNKPSSAESTPAAPGSGGSTGSGPPSNATVPFGSPQASPVPNGSAKPQPQPPPQSAPQQAPPPQPDSYAATAAAVAAGAGSYPMPKNPGGPPPPTSMYEQQQQQPQPPMPPHMQGPPPPHHVYYGQPPPHHPYWQQQMPRYPGPMPPHGSPYYPPPPQGYPHQYYPPPPQHHQGPPPPQAPQMHLPPQHRPPPPVPEYIKAQQQRDGAATPAAIGGQLVPQSPSGNSSVAGEDALEGAKSPSWAARGAQPSTSAAGAPPGAQNMPPQPGTVAPGKSMQSIVDKLTGPVNDQNPPRVMVDRRRFFESLVVFCEQNGDPITAPPQVSKQNIDLHRLYIAVRSKGGFMQVTKDKVWKNLCQQASSAITESSAAGYQLRKHYEKFLLKMECAETHRSYEEMIEFANKLKKKKKPAGDRESTGGAASSETGATTPATPSQQHTAPPSAATTPAPQGAPGAPPPLQQPAPQATPTPAPPRPGDTARDTSALEARAYASRFPLRHRRCRRRSPRSVLSFTGEHSNADTATTNANQPAAAISAVKALLLRLLQRPRLSLLPVLVSLVVVRSAHSSSEGIAPVTSPPFASVCLPRASSSPSSTVSSPGPSQPRATASKIYHPYPQPSSGHPRSTSYAAVAYPQASGNRLQTPQQQQQSQPQQLPRASGLGYPPTANGAQFLNFYQRPQYPSGCSTNPSSSASAAYAYRRSAAEALYPQQQQSNGQAPPPPGYHPGPPPPGADPNAAYYYPPQQQAPHGWPQQGPPPQGYPYGAPRMPPPHATYEEQQRYYHHQQQQQQMQAMPQQPPPQAPQQPPPQPQPSNTLQVDVTGGSQVNSRAPSAGPAAAGTPDSTSQHSAPSEDAANRPQSRPPVAPTPPASIAAQQPPPQGYYPGTPASTSYGSPRPPPARTAYPMAADGASTSGAYPPGMYPPGAHPQQMWQQQQAQQRYPGPGQVQQQHMQPPQGYGQQRRPPFPPYHLGQPGAPSPGSGAAVQMRRQYGGQPPQPGVPQAAVPQPHQAGTPSMMPPRGANQGTPQQQQHHHAPATTAALMASNAASQQPQSLFPPGCVEATQPLLRRRRKVLTRELVGLTPKRVMMSLRSGLDTEVVWAVNAMNIVLYDDSNPNVGAFSVAQQPEIISLIVEHLRATASVLFPEVFKDEPKRAWSPAIPTIGDEDFWAPAEDEEKVTAMKEIVSARSTADFNKVSRFGRSVQMEKKKAELPLELRRFRPAGTVLPVLGESEDSQNENEPPKAANNNNTKNGCGESSLSLRIKESLLKTYALDRKLFKEPEVPVSITNKTEQKKVEPEATKEISEVDEPALRDIEPAEWSEHIYAKPTGITCKFEALQKLVNRCLSLSNILRGYSFLPGNEGPMSRHVALLYVIGRFLTLRCDEISYATKRRERAEAAYAKYDESEESSAEKLAASTTSKYVDVEDDAARIMDDLANQLRDDAFVILCHLSAHLNMDNFDGDVAWPIFDGLIHWIVSKSVTAKDPLVTPCVLTPRAYSLEVLCKMSVIESNVDLLVSTGPWNRFESFLNRLAGWLTMSEEPHFREFSLVILNAICNISDEAVYYTVLHTPALVHIVYFLEFTDTAMHSVYTSQGMTALRDNPELMGTSVGMLRRAATLLHSFCRIDECRKVFIKQQQRLLALSMSQLMIQMDSRVAQMIVETLYEIQQAEAAEAAAQSEARIEESKKVEEPANTPVTVAATSQDNSPAAGAASPEQKSVEAEAPKVEEKMSNGTPHSDDSSLPADEMFRAPKSKKRPATPVVMENGSNGNYAKKPRRLENGTNGKLNGVIENQPPSIETKNSMAAVA